MRPVAPNVEGLHEVTVAEDQHEYMPLVVGFWRDSAGQVHNVSRWTFTPEERARVAAGEDVYVDQLHFGAMTPLSVSCGPHA